MKIFALLLVVSFTSLAAIADEAPKTAPAQSAPQNDSPVAPNPMLSDTKIKRPGNSDKTRKKAPFQVHGQSYDHSGAGSVKTNLGSF